MVNTKNSLPAAVSDSNSLPDKVSDKSLGVYLNDGKISSHQYEIARKKKITLNRLGKSASVRDILLLDKFLSASVDITEKKGPVTIQSQGDDVLLLPISLCQYYNIAPISYENQVLTIISARQLKSAEKRKIIDACHRKTNYLIIKPVSIQRINAEIDRIKKVTAVLSMLLAELSAATITPQQLSSVIFSMFTEAMKKRASDIHLDKKQDPDSWISYRIDGVLVQEHLVDYKVMSAIFARIKIDAGLDASNTRDAQDGRLSFEYANRQIDLRVASQPLADGETIAIRLLDPLSLPSFESLFPADERLQSFVRVLTSIRSKTGSLVLFSGPTGSGKTTSLYAIAQNLPRDALNVVTVEDPVEYKLPFARQIQLNQIYSETSRGTERSLLRQDPDIIILGEIRDADTAHAALKFMESGHMVMATIHASSVIQTFDRFISFFEGDARREALFALGHALRLLFNQRLVKKLCSCSRQATIDEYELISNNLADVGLSLDQRIGIKVRVGCDLCNQDGVLGRVLAAETLMVDIDDQVKSIVAMHLSNNQKSLLDLAEEQAGFTLTSRKQSIKYLLQSGVIDDIIALETLRV